MKLLLDIIAGWYEIFYRSNPFSNIVYKNGLYGWALLSGVIITFIIVISYYYIINSPKWNGKIWWLLAYFINTFINVGFIYLFSKYILKGIQDANGQYIEFTNGNYMGLCFSQIITVLILFLCFSIIAKYKSSNCSRTPF